MNRVNCEEHSTRKRTAGRNNVPEPRQNEHTAETVQHQIDESVGSGVGSKCATLRRQQREAEGTIQSAGVELAPVALLEQSRQTAGAGAVEALLEQQRIISEQPVVKSREKGRRGDGEHRGGVPEAQACRACAVIRVRLWTCQRPPCLNAVVDGDLRSACQTIPPPST